MPRISRLFIKTGLLYFLLAIVFRLLLDIFLSNVIFVVRPLFWHALMLGWITQIIFGVSSWMFPGRNKDEGFSAQKFSWLAYLCLNTGLILRFISAPLEVFSKQHVWNIILAISAVLLFAAVIFYVLEMWPRVMSKKQQRAKRKEQRRKRKKQQDS